MEPEERIRRMEGDGVLSARQAAMLRDSRAGGAGREPSAPQIGGAKRWTGRILGALVLAIVAVVLALALATGGDRKSVV